MLNLLIDTQNAPIDLHTKHIVDIIAYYVIVLRKCNPPETVSHRVTAHNPTVEMWSRHYVCMNVCRYAFITIRE